MFLDLFRLRPRTVGSSCLFATMFFGAIGYALHGGWGAAAGVAGAWLVHFAFWSLRYRLTEQSWRAVADEYGLELRVDGRRPDESEGTPVRRLLRMLTPPDEDFELAGTLDGRQVRMFVEGPADGRMTAWAVDVANLLPMWLKLQPSTVKATASRWLDLEDVSVGHPEFDDRVVVGGHDADRVREFFWDHDLAETLDELFDQAGPFEIEGGWIRHVVEGTTRSKHSLQRQLERVRTVANRLEAAIDEEAVLETDQGVEETEAAEEAVYVYGNGTAED